MKQAKLLWLLFKLKLSRAMMFRLSFIGPLFVDGAMFAVQIAMFEAIYGHVDSIAGWGRGEMLLFIGTFAMIDALTMTFFFFGVNDIARKIKSGEMDFYLTKPGSALFRLSFENVDMGSVPLIFMSAAILSYAVGQLPVPPSPAQVAGYVGMVLAMTLLWYDMMVLLRSIAFFVVSAASIDRVEGELLTLCMKLPGVAFKGAMKVVFMLILPYGLIATVPAEVLAGLITPAGACAALAIVAAFTLLAIFAFRLGMRNYKSAGG